ncbi:hypothetical protein OG440_39515 (plasmid) [Streptomyces sp. NBC_00637]|uniref:hypothetical protein n=1 Tax=Streptomyces sp. NBC_00637 TaxID=2903667 RepID=UPI002F90ECE4
MTNLLAAGGGLAGGGALLVLCLVACPLIMGAMAWSGRRAERKATRTSTDNPAKPGAKSAKQAELVRLQAEIDQLRAERRTPGRRDNRRSP